MNLDCVMSLSFDFYLKDPLMCGGRKEMRWCLGRLTKVLTVDLPQMGESQAALF